MSDLEEAKRLLGEIKRYVSWLVIKHSQEPHRLKIEGDIRSLQSLLENMKEGVNRADGPKSTCCGVAMVWINTKQHHICPNCGEPSTGKPEEGIR